MVPGRDIGKVLQRDLSVESRKDEIFLRGVRDASRILY